MNMHKQRKTHYTDSKLQGLLVAALIAVETILLGGAVLYLYLRFNTIVDNQLFKIHSVSDTELIDSLFSELIWVIAFLIVINIAALIIAHFIWARFVAEVLKLFRQKLQLAARLQFSDACSPDTIQHKVLSTTDRWIEMEKNRCLKIRAISRNLKPVLNQSPAEIETLQEQLQILKTCLVASPVEFDITTIETS